MISSLDDDLRDALRLQFPKLDLGTAHADYQTNFIPN
jgi:hypothetical protein